MMGELSAPAFLTVLATLLLWQPVHADNSSEDLLDSELLGELPQQDQPASCGTTGQKGTLRIIPSGASVLGGDVTLTCLFGGTAPQQDSSLQFHWLRDGQPLSGQHGQVLPLHQLSPRHEGHYTCRTGDNHNLPCTSGIHVLTVMVPPKVLIQQGDGAAYSVFEGVDLNLTCRISNDPKPAVKKGGFSWTYRNLTAGDNATPASLHGDTERLSRASVESVQGVTALASQLTVKTVTRLDSGLYSCHVTNDPDLSRRIPPGHASVQVQVLYLDSLVDVSIEAPNPVVVGDKVTLTCQTDSVPTANLTWLHQGRVFHTVESNEDVYSFTATGCQDSGEYQCRADNEALRKSFSNRTSLTVQCPPKLEKSSDTELTSWEGEITLWVLSTGNPPPVYTWSGPGLEMGQRSINLIQPHLRRGQSGVYTVNVSNQHGWFSQAFHVTVRQKDDNGVLARGDSGETTLWLTVGGGLLAVLLVLVFVCLTEARRRRGGCQQDESNALGEQQSTELSFRHHPDSGGQRGSQEVGDYTSGGSSGHYMSIDSADLSWQPQAVQPQDSLSQETIPAELHYDVPAAADRHPAPKPGCVGCQPAADVTDTAYINPIYVGGNNAPEELGPGESRAASEGHGSTDTHSSQESDSSEAYCVCDVIRGDSLAADSSAQQEDRPPPQGAADVTVDL